MSQLSTHCERCGHNLSDHDTTGTCMHAVAYNGNGVHTCTCDSYLRGTGTLAEELGRALFAAPGRDATGMFYSAAQAQRVGKLCEALLDTLMPTTAIDAIELCEAWVDAAEPKHRRSYKLEGAAGNAFFCQLTDDSQARGLQLFSWTSTQSVRDAAAKAIMKAGQEGFGS